MNMDTSLLGMKDLYDVQLKALYPVVINGVTYEIGEPFAIFESIQFGDFNEIKDRVSARGGYNNENRVTWETTKEMRFDFAQGVLSKTHLALLSNSVMEKEESIEIPKTEVVQVDESNQIILKYLPIESTLYLYIEEDGRKITDYTRDGLFITFVEDLVYEEIRVIYDFVYTQPAQSILIGRQLLNGFVELSGKTRLKDDSTGQEYTGVIRIPRLKITSDLTMRLGKDTTPVTGRFSTVAYPTGSKGREKVMDFIILSNDIDSDI